MSISTPMITNFTGGELSPRLRGRVDVSKYFNGCKTVENFHVHPHGGATRRSGLRFVVDAADHGRQSRLFPFAFNAEQNYVLEFGHQVMRVFKDRGYVLAPDSDAPYQIATPYTEDDLPRLRFAQSNDTMILVHENHPPRKLTRTDHDAWTLEVITFAPQTPAPTGWTGTMNGGSGTTKHRYKITAQGELDKSLPGEIIEVPGPDDLNADDSSVYVELSGPAREDVSCHYVYKEKNGIFGFLGKVGPDGTYRDDGVVKPDTSSSVLDAHNPFEGDGNYPSVCVLNENRLFMAGTRNNPNRVWYSRIGSLFDFRKGSAEREPADDDPGSLELSDSQSNAVEFLIPHDQLYVGTRGGTWTAGGPKGEALTPSNARAAKASAVGAAAAMPLLAGESALYVQRAGKKVMEMAYHFESDSFPSRDTTIFAEHITGPGLSELTYAQAPDSVVYGVRTDGVLLACTFMRDQEVIAWTRMPTDGEVESATCIHDDGQARDQLWVVVRRTVNGQVRRFIEYMEQEFAGSIEDAFFVDSGVSYDLPEPVARIDGLGHLEGRRVSLLVDGSVHADKTVENGEVELDIPGRRIHAGLSYISVLEPMPLEAGSHRGTAQTKRKRVTEVSVRLHNTVGGKLGYSNRPTELETIHFRAMNDPMNTAVQPFSGDKSARFPKGWTEDGNIRLVQDQPLPMTVLGIVPTVVVNE